VETFIVLVEDQIDFSPEESVAAGTGSHSGPIEGFRTSTNGFIM
jgi:hypothetical protein